MTMALGTVVVASMAKVEIMLALIVPRSLSVRNLMVLSTSPKISTVNILLELALSLLVKYLVALMVKS
jgi:hypothetical protein